ncbi:hypothetical protein P7K49_014367 [Saguinus oedipus]|uniref:Uncharacterized protein n=1 Tax=Saguinus oedipus TaxID=9490 RepID=A0ABQ9VIL8_SAGOE|nr:hypothetical protein P7K49_014367 [Saguinus oedipus]
MWSYKEEEEYLKSQNLRRGLHEMGSRSNIYDMPNIIQIKGILSVNTVLSLQEVPQSGSTLDDSHWQEAIVIFEKDIVVAHKAKSHPEVLIEEALAANTSTLIISTDILGTNPESLT